LRALDFEAVTALYRLVALALALTGSLAAAEPQSSRAQLERLAQRLAEMPGLSARFEEEKRISLLRAPLTSEGTLYYERPDRIARYTERPAASSWVLQGERLVVSDPDGAREVDLGSVPALAPFIGALRFVLRGDLASLERAFELRFEPPGSDTGSWRLGLTPREAPLRDHVAAIEIEGAGAELSSLRVQEVGGDETLERFSQVDPLRRFSEAERSRIFDVAVP
jgi:hypothetical protein